MAEQSYHQALAVAARQSAKLFELGAATSLARLWRDQGKRTEARDLLAPIYSWFTEGFDTPVLQDVKALHRDGIATATRLACWIVGRLKRGVNRRRCCSVASNLVLSGSHTELCGVDTKQSTYDLR